MLAQETLNILKINNIRLDKRKGQHYLINQNIRDKIILSADLSPEDTVLDIGAGIGTLTIPLAQQAGKVYAIEMDRQISGILRERLKNEGLDNVEIIEGDAARVDLPDFNKVVSNLPYKISSPITFRILECGFDFAILMYQAEFAERMLVSPGNPKYSRLSVMSNLYSKVEKLFKVSPRAFLPPPRVSSMVIKLLPRGLDFDEFTFKTSRALFQHKKKKSKKALLESFHEIAKVDKVTAKSIINRLDPHIMEKRPFQLEPTDIISISNELKSLLSDSEKKK